MSAPTREKSSHPRGIAREATGITPKLERGREPAAEFQFPGEDGKTPRMTHGEDAAPRDGADYHNARPPRPSTNPPQDGGSAHGAGHGPAVAAQKG